MTMRQLDKSEWNRYFDVASKYLASHLAEIEVTGLDIGDQIEANWEPLVGLSYDPKEDQLDVMLKSMQHLISHPQMVAVEDSGGHLQQVVVETGDGHKQFIKLKDPVALPAAENQPH